MIFCALAVTNGKIDIWNVCFFVSLRPLNSKLSGGYLPKKVALLTPFTSTTKLVAGFGPGWTHWMEKLVGRRGGGGGEIKKVGTGRDLRCLHSLFFCFCICSCSVLLCFFCWIAFAVQQNWLMSQMDCFALSLPVDWDTSIEGQTSSVYMNKCATI